MHTFWLLSVDGRHTPHDGVHAALSSHAARHGRPLHLPATQTLHALSAQSASTAHSSPQSEPLTQTRVAFDSVRHAAQAPAHCVFASQREPQKDSSAHATSDASDASARNRASTAHRREIGKKKKNPKSFNFHAQQKAGSRPSPSPMQMLRITTSTMAAMPT